MVVYFTDKEIVLPGQLLSDDSKRAGDGTYTYEGKVYASQAGMATIKDGKVHIIPVKAPYRPKAGDYVVGVVVDIKPNGVDVDLGGSVMAILRLPDSPSSTSKLRVGDVVYARVHVAGLRGVFLESKEDLVRLDKGILLHVSPSKVPRLIGRKGSMINLLKKETGCEFYIGRNGLVVVKGKNPDKEFLALSAIRMVEREAHSSGLTERVAEFLSSRGSSG